MRDLSVKSATLTPVAPRTPDRCNLCRSSCEVVTASMGRTISRKVRCTGCGAEQPSGTFGAECVAEWNSNTIGDDHDD